jgi:hypothetical protein
MRIHFWRRWPVLKRRCRFDAGVACPLFMRGNAAAIGFINLIYNLARYEQRVRLQLLPLRAV